MGVGVGGCNIDAVFIELMIAKYHPALQPRVWGGGVCNSLIPFIGKKIATGSSAYFKNASPNVGCCPESNCLHSVPLIRGKFCPSQKKEACHEFFFLLFFLVRLSLPLCLCMQMVFHYAQPAEKHSLGFINLGASGPQEIQLIYSHFWKSWTTGAVFLCTALL